MRHAALVLMDHHLTWSNYLFALFNHFSSDRCFGDWAQTVKVQRIPDRNQF
jgi:hypothetical protein